MIVVSRYQSEAPSGQPTHTPKIRIRGVAPGSPEYNALVDAHSGALRQFHAAQQQQVKLSGQRTYKASKRVPGMHMTYRNNEGQETIDVEVSPVVTPSSQGSELASLLDEEFGGYIYFTIDHTPFDLGVLTPSVPATFSLNLNGVAIVSGSFAVERDNSFSAVVLFGKNALHYHSYHDDQNEVTQKFISAPSPKPSSKYDRFDDVTGIFAGYQPEYAIFRIPGGVYGIYNMTLWDSANTPLLLDGTAPNQNRFLGGGVIRFDDISASPLKKNGKNILTVEITAISGVRINGSIEGEFFSRAIRQVNKSWLYAAGPDQKLFVNDKPAYIYSNFDNKFGSPPVQVGYGSWDGAENGIVGMLSGVGLNVSSPENPQYASPTSPVHELTLDLSK